MTCFNSIQNLRRHGKHVHIGQMLTDHATPQIPMAKVIAHELEILGSRGMQAHRHDTMLAMVQSGKLTPARLVQAEISLAEAPAVLMKIDRFQSLGATVITSFS